MDTWRAGLWLALVALPFAGDPGLAQQAVPEDMARVRQAIALQNRAWEEATVRGDAAAIGRIFADSGVEVNVRSGKTWKGRVAIQELFTSIYQNPHATDALVETEQVILDGRTAVEYGHFRFTYPAKDGQAQVESGKYVVVWRQEGDGIWRILMDMGVPGAP
jgi:uncharacterized protein (TIGR02246 family)